MKNRYRIVFTHMYSTHWEVEAYDKDVDVVLECKKKEIALFKYRKDFTKLALVVGIFSIMNGVIINEIKKTL